MFSGCRDDQTSADANIAGANVGAMSWALLEVMHRFGNDANLSYVQVSVPTPVRPTRSSIDGLIGLERNKAVTDAKVHSSSTAFHWHTVRRACTSEHLTLSIAAKVLVQEASHLRSEDRNLVDRNWNGRSSIRVL